MWVMFYLKNVRSLEGNYWVIGVSEIRYLVRVMLENLFVIVKD